MIRSFPEYLLTLGLTLASPAFAASSEDHALKNPHLFDATSGLRIDRYRAPTPDDVPGGHRISATETRKLIEEGAVAIDVFGAPQSRFDELDGTWLVPEPRQSLPATIWLPEVGRGSAGEEILGYFRDNLVRLTDDDLSRPIIIFCVADCWMSWNAVQRVTQLGYLKVYWFAEGTDGWLDEGWALEPVRPIPVKVD